MRLNEKHDTSIDSLFECTNKDTLFISTWDKTRDILNFPDNLIKPALQKAYQYKNDYFFSDEMHELKKLLINSGCFPLSVQCIDRIGVFSNGTTAAMLAIHHIRKSVSQIRSLLIVPTYFTYIKLLQEVDAEIYYVTYEFSDKASLPIEDILKEIETNRINVIVLTIPLFGTGLSPNKEDILGLFDICKSKGCYLVLDYLYGGMNWDKSNSLVTQWLWDSCQCNDNIILIESLCKKVFLNGMKSALVTASSKIIKDMERDSVHLVGSMSSIQLSMLQQLYTYNTQSHIISIVNRNIDYAISNYEILNSICSCSPIKIIKCNEGYFCLATMPLPTCKNEMQYSREILTRTNVLAIPHDRYLFNIDGYYTFRINLSLDKEILSKAIRKLSNLYT